MKNFDEQIAKAEEQIRQLNNKKKRFISEQKQAERKKRTGGYVLAFIFTGKSRANARPLEGAFDLTAIW